MTTLKEDVEYAVLKGFTILSTDRMHVKLIDGVPQGDFVFCMGKFEVHKVPKGWRTSKMVPTWGGYAMQYQRAKPEFLFATLREALDNAVKRYEE